MIAYSQAFVQVRKLKAGQQGPTFATFSTAGSGLGLASSLFSNVIMCWSNINEIINVLLATNATLNPRLHSRSYEFMLLVSVQLERLSR